LILVLAQGIEERLGVLNGVEGCYVVGSKIRFNLDSINVVKTFEGVVLGFRDPLRFFIFLFFAITFQR
jgi:hypothetical protein